MSPLRVLPATKTPHHRLCVPSQNGLVRDIPHPHSLIWPGIFAGGGSMGSPLLSRNSTGPSTMYGPAGFQVMIVGGVESLLYSRLCKQEYDQLESLLPSLMYFVVLPYEGHEAAAEAFAVN